MYDKEKRANEIYKYKGEGKPIQDKPSTPLNQNDLEEIKNLIKKDKPLFNKPEKPKPEPKPEPEPEIVKEKSPEPLKIVEESNTSSEEKEMFMDLMKEGRPYILKYNGNVVIDSEATRLKYSEINFQKDYLIIRGNVYLYANLGFKFKK